MYFPKRNQIAKYICITSQINKCFAAGNGRIHLCLLFVALISLFIHHLLLAMGRCVPSTDCQLRLYEKNMLKIHMVLFYKLVLRASCIGSSRRKRYILRLAEKWFYGNNIEVLVKPFPLKVFELKECRSIVHT
jgi:hypothetical protein